MLALLILIPTIIKPIIINQVPHETAQEFLLEHENEFNQLIVKFKKSSYQVIDNEKLKNVECERLILTKDNSVFVLNSFLDNSSGFVYSANEVLPELIMDNKPFYEEIKENWFFFSTN